MLLMAKELLYTVEGSDEDEDFKTDGTGNNSPQFGIYCKM